MTHTAVLEPLSAHILGYSHDAPQWGDELLEAEVTGLPDDLRRHMVASLTASRERPFDGPSAVADNILEGDILPLERKWRAYALDSQRRLEVRPWKGGVRTRCWTTRRVPDALTLSSKLPIKDGGCYLLLYGGREYILGVRDTKGVSVADDVRALRAALPVCDVIGWDTSDRSSVHWWSLAGGYVNGATSGPLDDSVINSCGGIGWGEHPPVPVSSLDDNLKPLSELVKGWATTDPQTGPQLVGADTSTLSDVANWLRRHLILATRSGGELTVTTPQEARTRLADSHLKPANGKFTTWVLDEDRKRVMIPSKWGMIAKRIVTDDAPSIDELRTGAPLPNKGRYLVIWGGDSRNDVFRSNKHVTDLLSQEFVADICAWAGGTFTSLRAELTVFADGTTREATASASEAEAHDSHKKGLT